jgi:hypothetical protein
LSYSRSIVDDPVVSLAMTIALVLIGLAAVVAGSIGIRLPAGERLAAGLPLVVGAGVGLVAIAVGVQVVEESPEGYERVFLVASALGFLATLAGLGVLWRTVARAR